MHLVTLFAILGSVGGSCLHNGCEMSRGLPSRSINAMINRQLSQREFVDNVLKIVSWKITSDAHNDGVSAREICRFVREAHPSIVGLQDVSPQQLQYLYSCADGYKIQKGEISSSHHQNIIVYKNSKRLKMLNSDHFSTNNQASTCVWGKFQFAERLNGGHLVPHAGTSKNKLAEKLSRILNFLIPQKRSSTFYRSIQSFYGLRYKWYHFYVAVININSLSNEEDAKIEVNAILGRLRNQVMERRRYPLIVLVDLGKEDNSLAYQSIAARNWLKNTIETSQENLPAMSHVNVNNPSVDMLGEQIWQSRFRGIVSAVITDDVSDDQLTHRPILAALLRHRKH